MKKLIVVLASAFLILSSCQKESPANEAIAGEATTTTALKTPVPDPKPPVGTFSAKFSYTVPDPNNIFENQTIQYRSLGSGIVSYVWTFGNGTKLYDANPAMSYMIHGFYNVTLTVYDINGRSDSSTQEVLILCNFGGGGNHD